MNPISKALFLLISRRRIRGESYRGLYNSISVLGELGSSEDISLLMPLLNNEDTTLRNSAVQAIKDIHSRSGGLDSNEIARLLKTSGLIMQLALIELMEVFPVETRKEVLIPLLDGAGNDLTYAIVHSLKGVTDTVVLDIVLSISTSQDLILRKMSYTVWFSGIAAMDHEARITYTTPLIHNLIRATYEMNDVGSILRDALMYANRRELPPAKAYPEFITRYLIELMSRWEYDPDIYRSLHQLVVPAYFTFRDDGTPEDRPFVQI